MRALLLIDLQNDFLPGGALPVPEGDAVIPLANRLQTHFDLVVATQDWHPRNHSSFAANHPGKRPGDLVELNGLPQVLWPVHCVQGTAGARFAPSLRLGAVRHVFKKGVEPDIDSYSGFFDNGHRRATGLGDYLRRHRVTEVCLLGLATDYCVKFTALDAMALGFRTCLIEDACRGVNLKPGDVAEAIREMKAAGLVVLPSAELLAGERGSRS
jgi:nicotinamidase/pyrazinamidase